MWHRLLRRLTGFEPTTLVTSFNAAGYEAYGRRFIETFEQCWPANYRLQVYAEDVAVAGTSARTEVLPLLEASPGLRAFRLRHERSARARGIAEDGSYTYRFDALKFANKAFALAHAAARCRTRLLTWLDADVVTLRAVPADLVAKLLGEGNFVAYLGRAAHHTETGFLAFDMRMRAAREFFEAYEAMYTTDEVFKLREWHDCEVFDTVRATLSALRKIRTRNLSPDGTSHPFVNSELGQYMDHLKGPVRKELGYTPASEYRYFRGVPLPAAPQNLDAGRYAYLPRIVTFLRPGSIVEIGTWSGHRAIQMGSAALAVRKEIRYDGFDLFEDATPEQDCAEMNVKPHYPEEQVEALLAWFAMHQPGFRFQLTKGDTREVLPQMQADLAFIDGGHSVETIRSDFGRLRASRVLVLDDWYDGPIDTSRFGCNRVIASVPHLVLPQGDPVAGGGLTRLAIVAERGILDQLKRLLAPE
jgi:hypothetical protein